MPQTIPDRLVMISKMKIGFDIAAQQKISLDSDDPAVGLGSYLVNAMGCNDCHTWPNYAPGGDPFAPKSQPKQVPLASYLAGGRLFALPTENVCSRNITPAPGTNKPAGLSRSDFLLSASDGLRSTGRKFPRSSDVRAVAGDAVAQLPGNAEKRSHSNLRLLRCSPAR